MSRHGYRRLWNRLPRRSPQPNPPLADRARRTPRKDTRADRIRVVSRAREDRLDLWREHPHQRFDLVGPLHAHLAGGPSRRQGPVRGLNGAQDADSASTSGGHPRTIDEPLVIPSPACAKMPVVMKFKPFKPIDTRPNGHELRSPRLTRGLLRARGQQAIRQIWIPRFQSRGWCVRRHIASTAGERGIQPRLIRDLVVDVNRGRTRDPELNSVPAFVKGPRHEFVGLELSLFPAPTVGVERQDPRGRINRPKHDRSRLRPAVETNR